MMCENVLKLHVAMGRPQKNLTKEQLDQVEGLASVLSMEQMADYFGVSRPTFYAIMERDENVSLQYKLGKAKAIADVGGGLLAKARNGDMSAITFYLKTQAGWRETDNDKKESQPIVIKIDKDDAGL